jgi:hypothetical protein
VQSVQVLKELQGNTFHRSSMSTYYVLEADDWHLWLCSGIAMLWRMRLCKDCCNCSSVECLLFGIMSDACMHV